MKEITLSEESFFSWHESLKASGGKIWRCVERRGRKHISYTIYYSER